MSSGRNELLEAIWLQSESSQVEERNKAVPSLPLGVSVLVDERAAGETGQEMSALLPEVKGELR